MVVLAGCDIWRLTKRDFGRGDSVRPDVGKRALLLRASAVAVVAVVVAAGGIWVHNAFFAPIDDPTYFCDASYRAMQPDQSPVSSLTATFILRDCPEARNVTLAPGQTVAVDLIAYDHGIDSTTKWNDLTVSNDQVLSTIRAPARVRVPAPASNVSPWRLDAVAVSRAARSGKATLNAVEYFCRGGPRAGCDQGHRWSVTVWVS
jgi:hypothetical protein